MTTSTSGGLLRLLAYWRGSVWKSIWRFLLIWICMYYSIRVLILYGMNDQQRKVSESVVKTFKEFCDKIPVSFLLGFYVGQVISRWWSQVLSIPWPDDIMAFVSGFFNRPQDKYVRVSVARWLVLCQAMAFRNVSSRVRRRFPELSSLIDAGLMTDAELTIVHSTDSQSTWWQLPLHWIINKAVVTPDQDLFPTPVKGTLINLINTYRNGLRQLFIYDWIGIPLVYAQTCLVVVYGYFFFCAIGHQYLGQGADLYIPWLTLLQLVFYVGWLRVAQDLQKPFGNDDDDLELNYILDRNAAVVICIADQVADHDPDLISDTTKLQLIIDKMKTNLAYSRSSLSRRCDRPPKMHASVKIEEDEKEMVTVSKGPQIKRKYAELLAHKLPKLAPILPRSRSSNWF